MRFWAPLLAFAAVAFAQNNQINTPNSGFGAQAGQPITITWSNPSGGDVDIRLTQGPINEPGAGTLLISNVPASSGTATFNLPAGTDLNGQPYNFEIVPTDDPTAPNFSSPFVVAGASGTGSSSASGSMSSTDSSAATSTDSSAATSTDSSASTTTDNSSMTTGTATTSHTSHTSSKTSSASSVATSAPHNGAGHIQVGGLLAMVAGAVAVF